jgi:hypothetical protein
LQVGVGSLLVVGVVAAALGYATAGNETPLVPGTARLIPGDAAVTVHRGTPVAAAGALLRAGDTVVVERGVAMLRTAAGAIYARSGSTIAITDAAPRITKGDALVQGKAISIAMRAATAEINGVARIRQGLSLELGVYRGGAVIRTVTETFGVPDLRRAIVAGIGGPASVTMAPLVINAADTWDRKFLLDAIELDAALTARSRGLTNLVAGRTGDVVDKVAASTGWTDLTPLAQTPIGEFVVAAELARAAHLDDKAIAAALALREAGASWGLIALEQGVREVPAHIAGLDDIVVPVIASVSTPATPEVTPTVTAPAATPKITTPTVSKIDSQPPVTVPPEPTAPASNPVAGLVEGVDNLLGGLLGGGR